MIYVAITRTVRVGAEDEFESRIQEFFQRAHGESATSDAYLIRSLGNKQYGILRSFVDQAEMRRFYESDLYLRWNQAVSSLVIGAPVRREIHGLEAFFRHSGSVVPTWKMALLTWVAVSPAVYVFSRLVPAVIGRVLPLLELLVVNALVVGALTWVLMPLLIRLTKSWLWPSEVTSFGESTCDDGR